MIEPRQVPVTVILPVLNEAANLAAALRSSSFASEVLVVDSGSTDATASIARTFGAKVILFSYDGSEKKKTWILNHVKPQNEWVFFLDADERISHPLQNEIVTAIRDPRCNGYFVDREFFFLGRKMRSFQPNWNMRLFRFPYASLEDFGLAGLPDTGDNEIHEHFVVEGPTGFLKEVLTHDDYRGIGDWVDRHNRYATWEAASIPSFGVLTNRGSVVGTSAPVSTGTQTRIAANLDTTPDEASHSICNLVFSAIRLPRRNRWSKILSIDGLLRTLNRH